MITINGEQKDIAPNKSIADILKDLKIEDKVMAVAVNMEIVKKEDWEKFTPKEGDKVEFLGFTGGG
ncbi:sulfur carrier protein [Nitratiruptor sp. YY09-18]|nr:sulfur carrier protein [Nitratiruptor sp. YY09-18]